MIALDTNVLIRFLTRDHQEQHAHAEALLRGETVFIPDTVFLETEWVLRFSYGYQAAAVVTAFKKLLGLPNVRVADPNRLFAALTWHEEAGLDFADALHLAQGRECAALATFDVGFCKKAGGLTNCKVMLP